MTPAQFTLRDEEPGDRDAVCAVHRAAFGGDDEARLVQRLRTDGEVVLGLVAEVKGLIVGHLLFSRLPIKMDSGIVPAVSLAPLAVLPQSQCQGIGTALVRLGLARCQERGVPAVVVLGDPAYYERFGFRAEMARGLQTPWSGPYLMAIELATGALGNGHGVARYPAAFRDLPSE